MENNNRILLKDDNTKINISDEKIVKYTAIYYQYDEIKYIKTDFIGIIQTQRSRFDIGITGIYIKPLYIYYNEQWNKIINYQEPNKKYFLYPHLLMIPNAYYEAKPIYTLDTLDINNINIDEITNTFDLKFY